MNTLQVSMQMQQYSHLGLTYHVLQLDNILRALVDVLSLQATINANIEIIVAIQRLNIRLII